MSDEHEQAGEVYEAEEVFNVEFPSSNESAIVLHPCEEPFDLPSAAIASQEATILCLALAVGSVG